MSTRSFIRVAALLTATLGSQSAWALPITGFSGSFSGTASGNFISRLDGSATPFTEPVTGSFAISTVIPPPYPDGCCSPPQMEPGYLHYNGWVLNLSIQAFGREIASNFSDNWPDSVTLAEEGTAQSLSVAGGGPYWGWSMEFVAPGGGLFQDLDPMTFDPTQVDMSRSFATFSDDIRSYGARVSFDSLLFDGYPSQVPEPATLALFGAGLLMLLFTRRGGARTLRR